MSPDESNPWIGKSILIVDDYATVRKTIKELVVSLGITKVAEAENGLQAQDILRESLFDLIISDLVMPEMDGFELTEAIRTSPNLRRIPIIITSTHDDHKYIFRALRLGANDYLIKPPTAEMIKIVLARIFDDEW